MSSITISEFRGIRNTPPLFERPVRVLCDGRLAPYAAVRRRGLSAQLSDIWAYLAVRLQYRECTAESMRDHSMIPTPNDRMFVGDEGYISAMPRYIPRACAGALWQRAQRGALVRTLFKSATSKDEDRIDKDPNASVRVYHRPDLSQVLQNGQRAAGLLLLIRSISTCPSSSGLRRCVRNLFGSPRVPCGSA